MSACSWCYQPLGDEKVVTTHLDEIVHMDCAMTAVGSGVERNDIEYQRWLGMSAEEIER